MNARSAPDDAELDFHARPGVMTDLTTVADPGPVPSDPAEIARWVQGVMVHPFWAAAYDVEVPDERQGELQLRSAAAIVGAVRALDEAPLADARPPDRRVLGNCRDHSVLATAALRHHGVPARARCGFANYFEAGKWVDHWIVEHWDGERWVTLDAQVDDLQREIVHLQPDPTDLPEGYFLRAGDAWLACRRGDEDGEAFGILDMWGQWFIPGNVGRDLAAMNKIEMLPWDGWGSLAADSADDTLTDEVAALLATGDTTAIRRRYDDDPALQVPPRVLVYGPNGTAAEVDVAELS